jgi:hypothetical protein
MPNDKLDKENVVKVLDMIAENMEKDAASFDGKPFIGKTVGTHYGYLCAAVSKLAEIAKLTIMAKEE